MLTQDLLRELQKVREEIDPYSSFPAEYAGELRRHALAEAIHYSTRIEGNTLTLEQVQRLLAGEKVAAPQDQVQEAENYREAIDYVQSLVMNDRALATEDTIRTIHFLVTKSLPGDYAPGQYRTSPNFVVDRISGRRIFLPPSAEHVPSLMREFVEWLNSQPEEEPVYIAALAHLNLVAIHPFLDGNGRTARILESLVMYRSGYKSQDLVSLETYFGRDTQGYYRALSDALSPRFSPGQDVTVWVDYYLQAHVEQARAALETMNRVVAELDALWEAFSGEGIAMWQNIAIWVACWSGHISSRAYQHITGRSRQTAALDFAKLLARGLLERRGRGRSTIYVPTQRVRDIFERARAQQEPGDPAV